MVNLNLSNIISISSTSHSSSSENDSVPHDMLLPEVVDMEAAREPEAGGLELAPVVEELRHIGAVTIEPAQSSSTFLSSVSDLASRFFPTPGYDNDFFDEDDVEQSTSDDEDENQIRVDMGHLDAHCAFNCMERLTCRQISHCIPNPIHRNNVYNMIILLVSFVGVVGGMVLMVVLLNNSVDYRPKH